MVNLILLFNLLIIFAIWTITSHVSIKTWLKNLFAIKGIIIILFEVLLLFQLLDIIIFPLTVTFLDPVLVLLGITINLLGTILAIWAKITMQDNWGTPGQHDVKKQNSLVMSGPFRFSRNPIYVGLFCVFLGSEIALRSFFIIFLIPLMIVIYKVVLIEEKLLKISFGKKYLGYIKTVPRFFKIQ